MTNDATTMAEARPVTPSVTTPVNYDEPNIVSIGYEMVIYRLWKIIDDIDTISDVVKSNDKLYRKFVEDKQKERFKIVPEVVINELYERFYTDPKTFEEYINSVLGPTEVDDRDELFDGLTDAFNRFKFITNKIGPVHKNFNQEKK